MADPESAQPAVPSAAPISFGFTRTSARRRLADPGVGEGRASEEKDFLKTVEGRELQSVNPPEAPKELVIPLIQNGSRRQPQSKSPKPSSETSTELMSDGVLSLAVKELIEESKKSLEERENAGVDLTLTIPMIQKGCSPSGEGTDSEPQAETVEGLDPDNVRAMVRLAVGNRIVTVSEYCLRPVSQQEFDSHTSQPGHVSKTSTEQQNRTTGTALSLKAPQNQEDSKRRQKDSERKRKHPPDRQDGPVAKSEKTTTKNKHWLHRDLRVRFIDKLHKGGRYYNTKMTIEDVPSPDTCVCRTDEGRVLEGVTENMLETLIPKGEGHRVMVVLGPHAGKVGLLLSRDSVQSQALVQLGREKQVVEFHYDAVCQYMGPSNSDED
ncbi:G-patch domain and KOW motifs-containing protein isoform X2 [Alexandromys fortis]|uniref:G-patch domain and KOW motifs-containing protein isoform X2 n=1 Tax=Alexandromys fortis TaxID=100897 RepID=UPI002152F686|nr:G-patch domain and KOW motifs-containing protein isoform X2 [Microtus fortis]